MKEGPVSFYLYFVFTEGAFGGGVEIVSFTLAAWLLNQEGFQQVAVH